MLSYAFNKRYLRMKAFVLVSTMLEIKRGQDGAKCTLSYLVLSFLHSLSLKKVFLINNAVPTSPSSRIVVIKGVCPYIIKTAILKHYAWCTEEQLSTQ